MEKQLKKWFRTAKELLVELRNPLVARFVAQSGIAIHGFWIPAIPAGMTNCVDTYAHREREIK
jgi:hypothetical protein